MTFLYKLLKSYEKQKRTKLGELMRFIYLDGTNKLIKLVVNKIKKRKQDNRVIANFLNNL